MENYPVRLSTLGQLFPECMSDTKSRFWQMGNQPLSRTEVICPVPLRATKGPFIMENLNRSCSKPNGILPKHRGDCALEILDLVLSKDDPDDDLDSSNQAGFFCGSPPVRLNNPVVHDKNFVKQTLILVPSPGSPHEVKQPSVRVERGSPSCGSSSVGSPKVRIEGFACGNPEPRHVLPAFA